MSNEPLNVELGEQDWRHLLDVLDWHTECPPTQENRLLWMIGRDRLAYIAAEIRSQSSIEDSKSQVP